MKIFFRAILATLSTLVLASGAQAATVTFISQVDPNPDILWPAPPDSYVYEHDLNSEGFNPSTDTLMSAEIRVYFAEGVAFGTDDSVTLFFDDSLLPAESPEPNHFDPFINEAWNDIFSVEIGLLQADGILSVTLQSQGTTVFQMSELTVQATRVIPIPASVWLFGSALGLIGWGRRRTI